MASNASNISRSLVLAGDLTVSKSIKSQFGSISSTSAVSPTTLYTVPSGVNDQGAYLRLLQLSNVHASATQIVNITVKTPAGSAFGLLRSGSIPSGVSLSVLGDVLPLATGSIVQGHIVTGTANNVEFVLGVEEIKG